MYETCIIIFFRLVHDRELQLFDGSRLMGKDKYDKIKEENDLTDQDMADRSVRFTVMIPSLGTDRSG